MTSTIWTSICTADYDIRIDKGCKSRDTVQMVANTWELIVLKIEYGKYFLYVYDTIKCLFKQKLEIKLPVCNLY